MYSHKAKPKQIPKTEYLNNTFIRGQGSRM